MKIAIEFHRTRDADDAHAIVGRESVEAADLDSAIGIARQLSQTSKCHSGRSGDNHRREGRNALFRHS
ncbi:hypothetical protein [Mesorhizobium xinjiangense]|uniref:hypothetical protein n=1 Tax=Mesorhizobium xinjiangense TaxID=2678685 RepID=UPI002E253FF0